jgi:hypothetical protein
MLDLQQTETINENTSERVLSTRSMDSIGDEPLAALVIDGVQKFRETIPAIIELRNRFSNRPRGKAGIAGCSTWTEFCTKKLGRTIRAVQKAIAVERQVEAIDDKPAAKEIIAAKDTRGASEVEVSTVPMPEKEQGAPAESAPALVRQHSVFELLSTLQKAIRRNDEREALLAAWQLDANAGDFRIAKKFGGQLWSAMRKICSEDVGIANFGLVREIRSLQANWIKATRTNNYHEPWRLFTVHAVLLLCRSPKSRLVDHACITFSGNLQQVCDELRKAPQPHPTPAYAHDGLHTGVGIGKSKAEARADFIVNEDAILTPKAPGIDDPYKQEICEALPDAQS